MGGDQTDARMHADSQRTPESGSQSASTKTHLRQIFFLSLVSQTADLESLLKQTNKSVNQLENVELGTDL